MKPKRLFVAISPPPAIQQSLVDLDPHRPMGLFEYSRVRLYISGLLGGSADVVNRKTLRPLLKDAILRDAVNVF